MLSEGIKKDSAVKVQNNPIFGKKERKKMSKKQKIIVMIFFVTVIAVIGGVAGVVNHQKAVKGQKQFEVEVVSERDNYSKTTECTSQEEFLGDFLRKYDPCEWETSEYGLYITGFDGMMEDMDNQYWWCITVNDEEVASGADDILLEEGSTYTFTLKQGW